MSASIFTVFRDDISPRHKRTASASDIQPKATPNRARSNTVSSSTPARSSLSTALGLARGPSAMNKENIDPETGDRALSLAAREKRAKGQKKSKGPRKAGVLQAKSISARPIKHDDENAGSNSSLPGSSSSDASAAGTRSRKRARTTTATLPSVIEEDAITDLASDINALRVDPDLTSDISALRVDTDVAHTWSDADIRCYELTVSPLADISPAFESAFYRPQIASQRTFRKERSATISDYCPSEFDSAFSSFDTASQMSALSRSSSCSSASSSEDEDDFSWLPAPATAALPSAKPEGPVSFDALFQPTPFTTPERAQIYSAFTFATPEPTPTRSCLFGGDRFGDIAFEPLF